jgi:enterochelin esterase-like enzyme
LPGAPPQPWLVKKVGRPEGKVEAWTIHSNIQQLDRKIAIYTPTGYAAKGIPDRLLVLFDGDEYLSHQMGITVTMNNLIAAHYHQFVGGHDALTWSGTIADAIIKLLGS